MEDDFLRFTVRKWPWSPITPDIAALIGKANVEPFMGFPPGTVVFLDYKQGRGDNADAREYVFGYPRRESFGPLGLDQSQASST